MTDKQLRTIELMKRLGSLGHTKMDGQNVYVSLPFAEDRNPNIKVWPDGSWHDFSGNSEKWEALGLRPHGTVSDLEQTVSSRFRKIWEELPRPIKGDVFLDYISRRGLSGDIRIYHDSLAFAIRDVDGNVIGIQTRRIDGGEPKCMMLHGSDGKHGMFMRDTGYDGVPVVVCEGATDTYTWISGCNMIGAISVSMLDGVKEWIKRNYNSVKYFVLAFDADEPGVEAQNNVLEFMLKLGIAREKIKIMEHDHGKDLNDEMNNHHRIEFHDLGEGRLDLFVRVVDEVSPEMEKAVWVGFFPPDFPKMNHSGAIDYSKKLYVFPESFGRSKVNAIMWRNNSSAYILRGW